MWAYGGGGGRGGGSGSSDAALPDEAALPVSRASMSTLACRAAEVGGGCVLAALCDMRISAAGTKWGLPEVAFGTTASLGGMYMITRIVGLGRAFELLYLGENFDAERAHLTTSVKASKPNAAPFIFLALSSSPVDQQTCAEVWANAKYPAPPSLLWKGEVYNHDRIRVAYVSADFFEHPVAYLMAGMFEAHDKSRVETIAISFGTDDGSDLRKRLEKSFDRFVDAQSMSEIETADLIKSDLPEIEAYLAEMEVVGNL
jgi:hypothetical protein